MKLRRVAPELALIALLSLSVLTGCTEPPSSSETPETTTTEETTTEPNSAETPTTDSATGDAPTAQAPQSVPTTEGSDDLSLNQQPLSVYWLGAEGGELELVPAPMGTEAAKSESSASEIRAAVDTLLAGPESAQHTTTIPDKTKLLDLSVENDGVHVDLSPEFTTGGGTASMQGRVAQILYTVTSGNPQEQVWLSVDGEPLEVLGGEGLLLDQPLTRQNFQENFGW